MHRCVTYYVFWCICSISSVCCIFSHPQFVLVFETVHSLSSLLLRLLTLYTYIFRTMVYSHSRYLSISNFRQHSQTCLLQNESLPPSLLISFPLPYFSTSWSLVFCIHFNLLFSSSKSFPSSSSYTSFISKYPSPLYPSQFTPSPPHIRHLHKCLAVPLPPPSLPQSELYLTRDFHFNFLIGSRKKH